MIFVLASANLTDTDHLLHAKPWENMSIAGALPPLALTVTSIDQSHKLEVLYLVNTFISFNSKIMSFFYDLLP